MSVRKKLRKCKPRKCSNSSSYKSICQREEKCLCEFFLYMDDQLEKLEECIEEMVCTF